MAIGLPPCMAKFSLGWTFTIRHLFCFRLQKGLKLDPVGSTVRHQIEAVYWVSIGHFEAVAVGN